MMKLRYAIAVLGVAALSAMPAGAQITGWTAWYRDVERADRRAHAFVRVFPVPAPPSTSSGPPG